MSPRWRPSASNAAIASSVAGSRVLASDASKSATRLRYGTLLFYLIERNGKLAVRVKDSQSPARREFHGLDYFPIDPSWRLEARFEPYDPPKSISVPNVLGHDDSEKSPGALVFERGGRTYRLDPVLERGETDYFVIFGDALTRTWKQIINFKSGQPAAAADAASPALIEPEETMAPAALETFDLAQVVSDERGVRLQLELDD